MSTIAKRVIPEALSDEDGETWFLQGHVEPSMAVLAVVFEQMVNYGPQEAYDLLTGGAANYRDTEERRRTQADQQHDADGLVECVTHVWMRPDPTNEEIMLRCVEGDDGAEAWTVVSP